MTRDYIDQIRVVMRVCGKRHKTHQSSCYQLQSAPLERFEQRPDGLWRDKR